MNCMCSVLHGRDGLLKDTIRVGIIGCGGIAFAKHMPFLSQISGVEIVGFYNPTEEKARRAKEQYGSKDAKSTEAAGHVGRPQH